MGEEKQGILGNNSVEDVSWLCSLSESELDMLISLKKLAMKRAGVIGHVQLAKKFDLKMLRALGFILVEYLKEKVKGLSLIPGHVKSAAFLDCYNLLNSKFDAAMSIEELKEHISFKTRKEFCKRLREEDASVKSNKRRSLEDVNEETESQKHKIMTSDRINVKEDNTYHD